MKKCAKKLWYSSVNLIKYDEKASSSMKLNPRQCPRREKRQIFEFPQKRDHKFWTISDNASLFYQELLGKQTTIKVIEIRQPERAYNDTKAADILVSKNDQHFDLFNGFRFPQTRRCCHLAEWSSTSRRRVFTFCECLLFCGWILQENESIVWPKTYSIQSARQQIKLDPQIWWGNTIKVSK